MIKKPSKIIDDLWILVELCYQNTIMYQLKALDRLFISLQDTDYIIYFFRNSHKTTEKTSNADKSQEFNKKIKEAINNLSEP